MKKNILLLGGSSEAFQLADHLHDHPEISLMSSLAGRTSLPRKPKGAYRTGGFGGQEGLATYLQTNQIHALIDATHPFAETMSSNAHQAATQTGTPHIQLTRPPWTQDPNDIWIEANTVKDAAQKTPNGLSPIFLTIGRGDLTAFLSHRETTFLTRTIEKPKKGEHLPDNFSFIYGKGPFSYEDEMQLIKTHKIKAIVSKNSGGDQAFAKIKVARALKIPVIMIKRPAAPKGPLAETTDQVLSWLATIIKHNG